MRARIIQVVLLGLLVAALSGCGLQPLSYVPTPIPTLIPATLPAQTVEQAPGGTPVGESPATAAPAEDVQTPGDAAAGEAVFNTYCTACHKLTDEQLVGPGLAGLFARDVLPSGDPVSDPNLRTWIRTGGGAMPGLALSDTELDDLLAFLHDTLE